MQKPPRFKEVDLNEDGELSLHELITGAENVPEFQSRLRVMDIDAAELEQILGCSFFLGDVLRSCGIGRKL